MTVRKRTGRLTVRLHEESTIMSVEEATGKVKKALNGTVLNRICLNIKDVRETDTSYLQMLVSLKKTASRRTIPLEIKGRSEAFSRICRLYGLNEEFGIGGSDNDG